MSDGPHRSLNMNRDWKRLAECADNHAFSEDDVAKAFLPALDQSCRDEVPPTVWRGLSEIFCDQQDKLFREQRVDQIRALRTEVAGLPLACSLIDLAVRAASKGPVSEDALVMVAVDALAQRAARGTKQVEEHYYRKSSEQRTERVRWRLENALKNAVLVDLARHHVGNGAAPVLLRSVKQKGVDDGVQL